jgi:hypothetical protein
VRKVRNTFNRRALLLAVALVLLTSALAHAQVSVVVSKASKYTPTEAEAKSYFVGVKLEWPDGNKVQVIDQPDAEVAKTFYEKFVGVSIAQVRKEWTKLILSGQASAPMKCANDDEVKKALAANPAAIAFIATASVDATVREIAKTK